MHGGGATMILPEGAESTLTEDAASPFLAEPAQYHLSNITQGWGAHSVGLALTNVTEDRPPATQQFSAAESPRCPVVSGRERWPYRL